MRLKTNFEVKQIGDEFIIVTESDKGWDYTRIVSLNEPAAFLIESSKDKDFSAKDWAELLESRYEVTTDQALADANTFIDKLFAGGFIAS